MKNIVVDGYLESLSGMIAYSCRPGQAFFFEKRTGESG